MSELDPVPPSTGAREWWHSVYGPMDPLAAQLVAVMWQRKEHGQQCPFYTHAGTPYDCDCWHRARAIVASMLIRDMQREHRWANPWWICTDCGNGFHGDTEDYPPTCWKCLGVDPPRVPNPVAEGIEPGAGRADPPEGATA